MWGSDFKSRVYKGIPVTETLKALHPAVALLLTNTNKGDLKIKREKVISALIVEVQSDLSGKDLTENCSKMLQEMESEDMRPTLTGLKILHYFLSSLLFGPKMDGPTVSGSRF